MSTLSGEYCVMTPIVGRVKRIVETPLGSRVMLPQFGSNLFELVDKTMDERYKLLYIAYVFEAFWNTDTGELWDKELEPERIIFSDINDTQISATVILTDGREVQL